MVNKKLEAALYYQSIGFSIIPIGSDKKPLISWKKYQTEKASPTEIERWFSIYPEMGIGIVTGKISGIVVVDIEKGGSSKGYPSTVTAKTGGEGFHLYYKHPGHEVPNGTRVRELTDIRGDGGYVVAPPSKSTKGLYEWIVSIDDADFAEMPDWINKIKNSEKQKGVAEGSRNTTAASVAGKIFKSLDSSEWENIGWPRLVNWNKQNIPPLPEKELRNVWNSIKEYQHENKKESEKKASQADLLLENIISREDVVLFHDEMGNAHASFKVKNHQEIRSCKSKAFRMWLSNELYKIEKKVPVADTIKRTISVIEGQACFDGPKQPLQNRAAWHEGDIWYDLTNEDWQAIHITKDEWKVVDSPPILFRRYSHHKPQIIPNKNGDVSLMLNYANIYDPEHRLLFLVYLISCFIPDFPHVALVIFGPQGSSKSTLMKINRLIIDPSLIDIASFPQGQKDLIQALAHHYYLSFDNVSYISQEQSDTLCKAITGGGHTTRELYTDDEDIIRNFRRSIGINGINLVTTRPDLLERSLLLPLERIDVIDRKTEKELYEKFNKELPSILGGVFDAIVKALKIHPTIKLKTNHRMADWVVWGCAIAESIGYTKEQFLSAYENNLERQTEMLLSENIVAVAIMTFMEDYDEWKGTPRELLSELNLSPSLVNIDRGEKHWPKGANILSRRLNELSTPLKMIGIEVSTGTSSASRWVCIKKIQKEHINPPLSNDTDDSISDSNKPLSNVGGFLF